MHVNLALGISALLVVALGAPGCGGAKRDGTPSPRSTASADARRFEIVVPAEKDHFGVGAFTVDDLYQDSDATLAGAQKAFGPEQTCTTGVDGTIATWPKLGIRGMFYTLGVPTGPDGQPDFDGSRKLCTYADQVQVGDIRLTDPRWHTEEGLHVGDPRARMLELYPAAAMHGKKDPWPGWWLAEIPDAFASPIRTGPSLLATVKDDRVVAFTVYINAGGD